MSWFTAGQVVRSKAGHDRGRYHIVLSDDEEYALIVDGRGRTLQSPKRKKIKHLQRTNEVIPLENATDKYVRGVLLKIEKRETEESPEEKGRNTACQKTT